MSETIEDGVISIEEPGEVAITADLVSIQHFAFKVTLGQTRKNAAAILALEWAEGRIKEQLDELRADALAKAEA